MINPSFDDITDDDNDERQLAGYVPFQFRKFQDDDEKTLEWLNDNFDSVYQSSKDRLLTYRRLSRRYKNKTDATLGGFVREAHRDLGETSDKPKVKTNFFVEYIDQKVAQVSKSKQNPVFIPLNDSEQDDINNAKACDLLVKFRVKEIGFESLMRKQDRITFKYGHSFFKVYWDPCAGPEKEDYKKATKNYGKVPVVDEKGKEVKGSKISSYEARIGDVSGKVISPDFIFPERKKTVWEEIDYVDEVCFEDIHKLQADYPDKEILKESYHWLDMDGRGFNQDDQVMKHYFYHRPTKYLEHGELIIYIESAILERIRDEEGIKKHMPDGELPFIPDTDIDVEDEFWAYPFLINIEQSNNLHDLLSSGMARNIGVASHPKLLIAEGSVNLKQADNKYGVMQWRGAHKPEWLQHNYINRGEFELQDRLEKRMDKSAKVYDISKGQVPAGITATSALRLLDDQELQANSETLTKRRERIKKAYWKILKFMDECYQPEDGRMARILGENNEYLIKSFKTYNFGKIYSVEIENISALQDTRSGRVSDIIDLNAANQKEPTFGRKEIIKLLDLGLEDAFVDEISYATTTSKTILEMLKHGEEVLAPAATDDLFEMYSIFSRFVESITYKMKLKDVTKGKIDQYIKGLEYLMSVQAKKNMLFAARLREFSKYPMFFTPGAELTAAPPAMPPAPGGGPSAGNGQAGLPSLNKKAQQDIAQTNGGMNE